ncbi:MAG: rhomboid family intramembrane serine protease [Myxococcales bacterium]|nr:rhomboid family intramembrane serine protease [Myxococcales bacterium]
MYLLIAAIVSVFVYQVQLRYEVADVIIAWGVTPHRFWLAVQQPSWPDTGLMALTIVTAMFLHSGYLHLGGNILYLHVFGERVEAHLGHIHFMLAYLGAGICGSMVHIFVHASDTVPMIGASGAIAGVLGIYVVLFPAERVTTLFPALVVLTFVELPAVVFVAIWAAQQALNGYMLLAEGLGTRDVAWMAHIGGFVWGLLHGGWLRLRGYGKRPQISDVPRSVQ